MSAPLVLSLFPGIGLLDRAFEEEGFCVVRGPDVLWGGDIRNFHPPAGRFDGVIGGPPCQVHSTASKLTGSSKDDLVPEFVRCVREAQPVWSVMENVEGVLGHPAIPKEWNPVQLNDFDCGGLTSRTRAFWLWPMAMLSPGKRGKAPHRTVMATTWKRGRPGSISESAGFLRGDLPVEEYGRLQGCEEIAVRLRDHDSRPSKSFIIHVLGNGVPLPMGRAIARAVKAAIQPKSEEREKSPSFVGVAS